MIISVLNLKGGVGKTTISTNLAVGLALEGYSVLIIDTDSSQSSAMDWYSNREVEDPPLRVISIPNANSLKKEIISFNDDHDFVIIDGSPQISQKAAISIAAADLILLPLGPSFYDTQSTQRMMYQVEDAMEINPDIKAHFVLNRYNERTLISRDTGVFLEQFKKITLLDCYLSNRVAYAEVAHHGLSVLEWNNPKAKEEMQEFINRILSIIT